jgi:hypothetical protein
VPLRWRARLSAVWSDPSDPRKTYQNAAQALLTELCERSGITRFTRVRVV